MNDQTRLEKDSMGEVRVPADALYGASTQRAVENFPISGIAMPTAFLRALGRVKRACARANVKLGELDPKLGGLIEAAATELAEGKLDGHFPVDVFQTGSGTSTNTNANEVIANRVSQLAGEPLGSKRPAHPNDHVNRGQSSNDVIPTALHVSVALALRDDLAPALRELESELRAKSEAWKDIVKLGRTHLMDATPLSLGQEFSGYARQAEKARLRCQKAAEALQELAIGGTAVGTGINTRKEFASRVCRILSEDTKLRFREADNHFEQQGGRDDAVEVAGHLCAVAAALTKIANDIRLLGSGPRAGLGEILLPATQPGSSIMPGKVNPVMSEMLVQVCHYAVGHCQTVVRCGQDGHFELNVTLPLIVHCLHDSIRLLANGARQFAARCVSGLEPNRGRCRELVEKSLMLATALAPLVGYDQAAIVAKKAYETNRSIKQVALELGLLSEAELDAALDPASMIAPKEK